MDREEQLNMVGDEEEFNNFHKITTSQMVFSPKLNSGGLKVEQERILIKTPTQLEMLKRRKKPKEDKYSIILSSLFNENEYSTQYITLEHLFPAQCRYSSMNVCEKITKIVRRRGAVWVTDVKDLRGRWIGKWKNGASVFPPVKAFPVIKSKWGYVLIDGHHHVLAGIALGATEIPIKLVDNYSELEKDDFWKKMEDNHYAHLYDLRGKKVAPPNCFSELEDDPNRYFALLLCRKYSQEEVNLRKPDGEGSKFPVWLKIGKDIPFVEFVISDLLWKAGVIYDAKWVNNVPEKELEKARGVISVSEIPGLKVVKTKTSFKDITGLSEYVEIAERQLEERKKNIIRVSQSKEKINN